MSPLHVLVVDDHAMFRTGVRAELQKDPGVVVVGEAEDVDTAVPAVLAARPDVVLLDVHMPGGGGAEVIRRVLPQAPEVRFLALSVSDAAEDVIGVIRAGARGYVTKTMATPCSAHGSPASCSTRSPAPSRSRRSTRTWTASPSASVR